MSRRAVRALAVATLATVAWTAPGAAQAGAAPAQPPVGETSVLTGSKPADVRRASTDSVLDRRTREVASQLRCVVCQGLSIQDSPSELAQQMRAVVQEQLAQGKSPDEVKAYFIDKYGEWILLEPKASGFNLLVYALPAIGVIAGLGLVLVVVRRWTAPAGATGDGAAGPEEAFDDAAPHPAPHPARPR